MSFSFFDFVKVALSLKGEKKNAPDFAVEDVGIVVVGRLHHLVAVPERQRLLLLAREAAASAVPPSSSSWEDKVSAAGSSVPAVAPFGVQQVPDERADPARAKGARADGGEDL